MYKLQVRRINYARSVRLQIWSNANSFWNMGDWLAEDVLALTAWGAHSTSNNNVISPAIVLNPKVHHLNYVKPVFTKQ